MFEGGSPLKTRSRSCLWNQLFVFYYWRRCWIFEGCNNFLPI